jgi:hypothetical protein
MNKETGGPAFPFKGAINDSSGMTLRDYFAAKAMTAIIGEDRYGGMDATATYAYRMADAMLKAREQ